MSNEPTTLTITHHGAPLCTCTLSEFGGIETTDPHCPWGVHTD